MPICSFNTVLLFLGQKFFQINNNLPEKTMDLSNLHFRVKQKIRGDGKINYMVAASTLFS